MKPRMKSTNFTFGILILLSGLLTVEVYFPIVVIILFYQLVQFRGSISYAAVATISPLFLMLVSGTLFISSHDAYDALKDIWYVGKVIVFVLLGVFIGQSIGESSRWLRFAAICSSAVAFFDLVSFFVLDHIEQILPDLGGAIIIAFFLHLSRRERGHIGLDTWLIVAPALLAVLLSGSRTTILVFIVALLGAKGIFQSRSKLAVAVVSIGLALAILVPILPQYDPMNLTFLGKVQNSINEIMFVNGDNLADISANWRGFEAARAFSIWQSSSIAEQIFGLGLGQLVDLGIYYELHEGSFVRYLPILHNAYFTVLVKFGALGLVLFIYFMSTPMWMWHDRTNVQSILAKRIGVTTSIVLLVSTLSISGPLNKAIVDGVTLLMGCSIGILFKHRRIWRLSLLKNSE